LAGPVGRQCAAWGCTPSRYGSEMSQTARLQIEFVSGPHGESTRTGFSRSAVLAPTAPNGERFPPSFRQSPWSNVQGGGPADPTRQTAAKPMLRLMLATLSPATREPDCGTTVVDPTCPEPAQPQRSHSKAEPGNHVAIALRMVTPATGAKVASPYHNWHDRRAWPPRLDDRRRNAGGPDLPGPTSTAVVRPAVRHRAALNRTCGPAGRLPCLPRRRRISQTRPGFVDRPTPAGYDAAAHRPDLASRGGVDRQRRRHVSGRARRLDSTVTHASRLRGIVDRRSSSHCAEDGRRDLRDTPSCSFAYSFVISAAFFRNCDHKH